MTHLLTRALVALVLAACAGSAYSADNSLSPDPTGLWFDSAHPGWGLDLVQQGDTAFAVIFTYDAGHQPAWFVASNLVKGHADFSPQVVMTGTLYRTTGPAFSAASFDPHAVGVTPVGDLQISYAPFLGTLPPAVSPRQLALSYSVDGVQVSKTLQAQTWSQSAQDLLGDYAGQFFFSNAGSAGNSSLCPSAATVATPQPGQPYTFSITPGAGADHADVRWNSGDGTTCRIEAAYGRDGQIASLAGNVECATAPSSPVPPGDPVLVTNIVAGISGFSASAQLLHSPAGATVCSYSGTFGGVLTQSATRSGMTPDPTGLWFSPQESGWGLILTQQGTNIFAALFAYGADGKATWWVASNVVDTGQPVNLLVGEAFAGTLYSTTGPYFGAPTDATAVSVTPVGSLRVAYVGGTDRLSLSYTVNGVTVEKALERETWSSNGAQLSGNYTGGLFPASSACGSSGIFATFPTTFTATPSASPAAMRFTWGTGIDTACVLDSTYVQTGQLGSLSGLVQCGPVGSPTATLGLLTLSAASVSPTGFSGFANFTGNSCSVAGFVGGVIN